MTADTRGSPPEDPVPPPQPPPQPPSIPPNEQQPPVNEQPTRNVENTATVEANKTDVSDAVDEGSDYRSVESETNIPAPPVTPSQSPHTFATDDANNTAFETAADMSNESINNGDISDDPDAEPPVFPVDVLQRLEDYLGKQRWIVPVLPGQELHILIDSAIKLCKNKLDVNNEACQRFFKQSLHLSFTRIMTDEAVKEWKQEILRHIYKVSERFLELCVLKLEDDVLVLLDILALVLNPKNKYHCITHQRVADSVYDGQDVTNIVLYARSPENGPTKGWLVDLINKFGQLGGFQKILDRFKSNVQLNSGIICALLKPFGLCYAYLIPTIVETLLQEPIGIAHRYMQSITDDELKREMKNDSRENNPMELVRYLRNLSTRLPGQENMVQELELLRLKIILRVLQTAWFSGKMNALNEISKILQTVSPSPSTYAPTQSEESLNVQQLVAWIRDNELLSVAIKENLHQIQYVEKLEKILRFMIKEKALTLNDLDQLWAAQSGKHDAIVKNVHDLLAKVAWDFTAEQLDHLFGCFQTSWTDAPKKQREKLLELIRRLAEDDRDGRCADKVLQLLWNLARNHDIPADIMDQALQCHSKILDYSCTSQKEQQKVCWLQKCVEEIRSDVWVLPAMKHFRDICIQFPDNTNGGFTNWPNASSAITRNRVINTLQNSASLVALITNSLVRYMDTVRSQVKAKPDEFRSMDPTRAFFVDRRYDHTVQVQERLAFLKFVLRDGQLWLCEEQAKQIWDTLVSNPIFASDRDAGFRWFVKMMGDMADLDPEIQRLFFQEKVLQFDPTQLSDSGMKCFERFFKHVNQLECRLVESQLDRRFLLINSFDLLGQEYLWRVVLSSNDEIANRAIELLREVYTNPSPDMVESGKLLQLHTDFIQSCIHRLKASYDTLTILYRDKDGLNLTHQETVRMTRVLRVLRGYIVAYDEQHNEDRVHVPLCRASLGRTVMLVVHTQTQQGKQQQQTIDIHTHTNATIASVKRYILRSIRATTSANTRVELSHNGEVIENVDDKKVLEEFGFYGRVELQAKLHGSGHSGGGGTGGTTGQNGGSSAGSSSGESSPGEAPPGEENVVSDEYENTLPSTWMCQHHDQVDFLLKISDLGTKLESAPLRDWSRFVLRCIPGDKEISDRIYSLTEQAVASTTSNVQRGGGGQDTPNVNNNTSLHSVFFASSPSEVLYSLELMYAMLAPAKDSNTQRTLAFQTNFVKAGGVQICLSTLLQNNFLCQTDSTTKATAFWHVLRLLRVLLTVKLYAKCVAYGASTGGRNTSDDDGANQQKLLAEKEYIENFLMSLPGQNDILLSRLCRTWAENLGLNYVDQAVPEVEHACMVIKLAWAAAAGNPSLYSAQNPDDIHAAFLKTKALTNDQQLLSREAVEVFTLCVILNPSIMDSLTREKFFKLCIIDLLFCPSESVRVPAYEQFYILATKSYVVQQRILRFYLTLLFTVIFTTANENSRFCQEYFHLLRGLLAFTYQTQGGLTNAENYLEKEIVWLQDARDFTIQHMESYPDELLLEGHLMVTRALVDFLPPDRKLYIGSAANGPHMVKQLLEDFLLPSSRMFVEQKSQPMQRSSTVMDNMSAESNVVKDASGPLPRSMTTIYSPTRCVPVCGSTVTITAAFDLIAALCTNCVNNMKTVVDLLNEMYFNDAMLSVSEWEYAPPVNLRNASPFVGLKNPAATCYMNSVFQQLFMIEPLRVCILNSAPNSCQYDDSDAEESITLGPIMSAKANMDNIASESCVSSASERSPADSRKDYNMGVLHCVQFIFANLLGSQLQFYVPKRFWKHFRFGTDLINLREQHDAVEFMNCLVESLDEALKVLDKPQICNQIFGGTFADQKICKGCPHRYSREEPFMMLSLDVRNHHNLVDSLQEYVKGDLLESENAYLCEKCNKKVDAIKRLCIKKLPPILVVQLKRFDFDWEREQSVKFNDYFEFPREIDMEPYTVDGLAKLDGASELVSEGESENEAETSKKAPTENPSTRYKLRGIIVHSGQANGGHYFSYILQRMPDGTLKWFKFDDHEVIECRLDDDEELQKQCFGGEYTSEVFDHYLRRMQQRRTKRWWNAYILLYERIDTDDVLATAKALESLTISSRIRQLPPSLEDVVNRKNMKSCHRRNQYTSEFFHFVRQLCMVHPYLIRNSQLNSEDQDTQSLLVLSTQLVSKFLFSTGLRAKRSLRGSPQEWIDIITWLFRLSTVSRVWFTSEMLFKNRRYFAEFLLESPSPDVRSIFSRILLHLAHYTRNDSAANIPDAPERSLKNNESISSLLIRSVLMLLHKEVSEYGRHLKEYFSLFYQYALMGVEEKRQLLHFNVPLLFIRVVLDEGPGPPIKSISAELQKLYATVSLLIRACDVSQTCKTATGEPTPPNPWQEPLNYPLIPIPEDLLARLIEHPPKFLKRLLDDAVHMEETIKLIKFLCWENFEYSKLVLVAIFNQIRCGFGDLRPLLDCLHHVLILGDSWTDARIQLVLRGTDEVEGLFSYIHVQCTNNPRRTYLLIKMLAYLFDTWGPAANFLKNNGLMKRKWREIVTWLQCELNRRPYGYNNWSPPAESNETGSGVLLERTKSSKMTLACAERIVQSMCAEEDEGNMSAGESVDVENDDDCQMLGMPNAPLPSHPPPAYSALPPVTNQPQAQLHTKWSAPHIRMAQSRSDSSTLAGTVEPPHSDVSYSQPQDASVQRDDSAVPQQQPPSEKIAQSRTEGDLNVADTSAWQRTGGLKRSAASTDVNMAGSYPAGPVTENVSSETDDNDNNNNNNNNNATDTEPAETDSTEFKNHM